MSDSNAAECWRLNVAAVLLRLKPAGERDLIHRIKAHSAETPVVLLASAKRMSSVDAPAELMMKKGAYAPAELLERIRLLLTKRRGPRRTAPPSELAHDRPAC